MTHFEEAIHAVHPGDHPVARFNRWLAVKISSGVGTMWCAYIFTAIAIFGFPWGGATAVQYVQWFAQTFLQLVLLSVIMVGQSVQGAHSEQIAIDTYSDSEKIWAEIKANSEMTLQILQHVKPGAGGSAVGDAVIKS